VSRVVFAFMWLAHFLPLRMIAAIGNAVGAIVYWLIPERRRAREIQEGAGHGTLDDPLYETRVANEPGAGERGSPGRVPRG